MNKREKAIWNLVVSLGVLLLIVFANNIQIGLIGSSSYDQINEKTDDFKNSIQESVDYKIDIENTKIVDLCDAYNLNTEEMKEKTRQEATSDNTQSKINNFMEHRKIINQGQSLSSVRGRAIPIEGDGNDVSKKKIPPGEYFLTEIAGAPGSGCKKNLKISNIAFKNDNKSIQDIFKFKYSDATSKDAFIQNCEEKNNTLYITSDGEVLYNSSSDIYGFEFNVRGSRIAGINKSVNSNFKILHNSKSVTGLSISGESLPEGCGQTLVHLNLDKEPLDIFNFIISGENKFYDLEKIQKYPNYDKSLTDKINYFNSKLNANDNLELYIKTNSEIDEYYFEVSCFKCEINDFEEDLNELEINLNELYESDFILTSKSNDPTDLSNIIMFDGNYNQNKKRRTVRPLFFYTNQSGEHEVSVAYQGNEHDLRVGSKIGEIEITKINVKEDYFLGKYKNGKIDTLGFQN